MSEQQLARMEDMLTQLVGMVTKNNEKVDTMSKQMQTMTGEIASIKKDQNTMSSDIGSIKKYQKTIRAENDQRHEQIIRKFGKIEQAQDYTFIELTRHLTFLRIV